MNFTATATVGNISGATVTTEEGAYLILIDALEAERSQVKVFDASTHEGLFACEVELPHTLIQRVAFIALSWMAGEEEAYIA